MSKQIKTIKCPQCGSTQKTELEPDHYRCDSCGVEYFLDDDAINVNVRHTYDGFDWSKIQLPNMRGILKWVVILSFLPLLLLVPVLFISTCSSIFSSHTSSSSSKQSTEIIKGLENEKYSYSVYESTPVIIKGKAYIVCLASRSAKGSSYTEGGQMVYFFYDITSGTFVHETVINNGVKYKNTDMQRFADGNCYLSINKSYLYKLNKDKMRFEDYLPYICQLSEEFSSGVAIITIANSVYGETFNITSNIGDEYKYYPIANKLYTEKATRDADNGMDNLLPGARDSVMYVITDDIYPPVKLVEATFKYNAGGPMDMWLVDRIAGDEHRRETCRIIEFHDLTPGRNWFDAYVAYYGHDDLLVSARTTPADDAQLCIQKIDTKTGKVLWSTPMRTKEKSSGGRSGTYFAESIKVGNLYIIKDESRHYIFINNNGKLIREINLTII